ncbi:VPGUxxT family thioredoxin-like (seleno)protein, type 2 [Prosthecobacter sp.]|uniref:VPGUxxT family thioredoxin-like (seleno)protein, type 2 n=1 Tax=Prosthecobacter sp. TaxID=1965333 RepID=UPI003783D4EA
MKLAVLSLFLMLPSLSCSAASTEQPVEAGTVHWGRVLETALASSGQSGKPVFALFQEIPGCAGCKQFGREVMSHPLIVAAVETEFTPLLIHNNQGGRDLEVLKRFGEPAWNYQVVRFLNAQAEDIIPRKDQVWDTGGIAERMVTSLTQANRPVPAYLKLLAAEQSPRLKEAVFAMYCFWTGEMELGRIDGVITTEAGFMDGREVTRVKYDPQVISLPQLIAAAEKVECANAVSVPAMDLPTATTKRLKIGAISGYRTAPKDDQKKQISGTAAAKLTLSPSQATKVNAWIRTDPARASGFLTKAQQAQLKGGS